MWRNPIVISFDRSLADSSLSSSLNQSLETTVLREFNNILIRLLAVSQRRDDTNINSFPLRINEMETKEKQEEIQLKNRANTNMEETQIKEEKSE